MYSNVIFPKNPWFMVMFATGVIHISILVHPPSDEMLELCSWDFNEMILLLDIGCKESKTGGICVYNFLHPFWYGDKGDC